MTDSQIKNTFCEKALECGCDLLMDEPMSRHTTFKIGGPAEIFVEAKDVEALKNLVSWAEESKLKYMLLGNGSNLLVSDKGIEGAVITLGGEFKDIRLVSEDTIACGAGVTLAKLSSFALENSLEGLEFAWGIPGTVGGAVFMNAGAYGGEIKDVLKTCRHMTQDGQVVTLSEKDFNFGYRKSIYKENKWTILDCVFKLKKGNKEDIKAKMTDFMNRRTSKQPLEYPSAGSVFKRPEGNFAGTLIEQCGLKGTSVGGACVSEKHAGFIINKGGATCKDVCDLVELIQKTVKDKTGYQLERELIIVE